MNEEKSLILISNDKIFEEMFDMLESINSSTYVRQTVPDPLIIDNSNEIFSSSTACHDCSTLNVLLRSSKFNKTLNNLSIEQVECFMGNTNVAFDRIESNKLFLIKPEHKLINPVILQSKTKTNKFFHMISDGISAFFINKDTPDDLLVYIFKNNVNTTIFEITIREDN